MASETTPVTYAGAGVDVEAGDRAVALMKASVSQAQRPEVLGVWRVRGMFDASVLTRMTARSGHQHRWRGTKVAIAQAMDKHDTIGIDLVGMVVDDIVVCGAEPLFMTTTSPRARWCPNGSRPSSLVCGRLRAGRVA